MGQHIYGTAHRVAPGRVPSNTTLACVVSKFV